MTRRIPELSRAMPGGYVEIHAEDAADYGLRNGDKVKMESRRGSLVIPVWIDGRGQPPRGTVFIPFFDETLLVNDLTLDALDPFSKQPDYKKSAVRIRKV
jgi:nitrate reductase NapA